MVPVQKRLKGVERRRQVLELAKAGYSFRQMAAELGISHNACYEHFQNALKAMNQPLAEEVLALELARLDAMHQPLWPTAQRGNLKSQAAVLHLMERRAAYLGLDAPKRVQAEGTIEVSVVDARERVLAEVQERRARLQMLPPATPEEAAG